jgi:hypothetical protein
MAVNVAERMRVYQRERLTVAIGKAEMDQVIVAVGEARGEVLTDEIKVGSLMRVDVEGGAFAGVKHLVGAGNAGFGEAEAPTIPT